MDNYYASIRAMVYRPEKEKDASSSLGTGGSQTERKEVVQEKTQKLPVSIIKIIQELLSDKLDIGSKSNSEIVKKCVSILKLVADFFCYQRKKIQSKNLRERGMHNSSEGLIMEENKEKKDVQMSDSEEEKQEESAFQE